MKLLNDEIIVLVHAKIHSGTTAVLEQRRVVQEIARDLESKLLGLSKNIAAPVSDPPKMYYF